MCVCVCVLEESNAPEDRQSGVALECLGNGLRTFIFNLVAVEAVWEKEK